MIVEEGTLSIHFLGTCHLCIHVSNQYSLSAYYVPSMWYGYSSEQQDVSVLFWSLILVGKTVTSKEIMHTHKHILVHPHTYMYTYKHTRHTRAHTHR